MKIWKAQILENCGHSDSETFSSSFALHLNIKELSMPVNSLKWKIDSNRLVDWHGHHRSLTKKMSAKLKGLQWFDVVSRQSFVWHGGVENSLLGGWLARSYIEACFLCALVALEALWKSMEVENGVGKWSNRIVVGRKWNRLFLALLVNVEVHFGVWRVMRH